MKLRSRLYAISFISCIIPMTFMGFFINSIVSSELKKEKQYKTETTLHNVNEYLGDLVEDVNNSVDNIAYIIDSHQNNHMSEYLIDQMRNYGDMREEVDGYYFSDPKGRFFSGWSRSEDELKNLISNNFIIEDYDPRERPWYISAKAADKLTLSVPYIDAFDGNITISASKRIGDSNDFRGVIGVDFNIFPIAQELESLNPWTTGGFLITTKNGKLLIDANSVEDFYHDNRSIIQSGISGEQKSLQDKDINFKVIPLDHFDFKLIGIYSEKEVYSTLTNVRNTIFITMIVSLIFSTIITAIFGRKLNDSLDRLSYLINSIARGNYTKNIDTLSSIIDDQSELFLVKEAVKNMQSEIQSRELQLKNNAEVDGLTNTLNRKTIINILEAEMKRSNSFATKFSIIMFDYDRFKNLNDNYGHLFGDQVLIDVSKYIKDSLKEDDFVGRYGGEEFIIILPDTVLGDAVKVGERIRKTIENMVWETGIIVTISCGIVQGNGEHTVEEIIKKADDLLYKAKDNGRNRIEY